MKWLSLAPYLLLTLSQWGCLVHIVGCASGKAVDTTRLAEAISRSESTTGWGVVPKELSGMPGALVVPTVPGKNVEATVYYPDGQLQFVLRTSRSAVLDVMLAGLNEIDAAKFAADAAQREWVMALLDRALAVAQPFITSYLNRPPPTPGEPGLRESLRELLNSPEVKAAILEAIRGALPTVPTLPASQPVRP